MWGKGKEEEEEEEETGVSILQTHITDGSTARREGQTKDKLLQNTYRSWNRHELLAEVREQ
jgi:hypothetical protein